MTEIGLHTFLETLWTSYTTTQVELKSPKSFVAQLPKKLAISPPFGSVTFIEGQRWVAMVQDGYGMFGRDKALMLRWRDRTGKRTIPSVIRKKVGLNG